MEDNEYDKVLRYLCCTRMPGKFNRARFKTTLQFNNKTFYGVGLDDIDPKIRYKVLILTNPRTNEKVMLYW